MINEGFPPAMASDAKVLILGSMPGVESLKIQQYYGNPRNAFWWIISELFPVPQDLSYAERVKRLLKEKIALWDVIASCERKGSLDSDIKMETVKVNDFKTLQNKCPNISHIFLNGKTVESFFKRFVLRPGIIKEESYQIVRLPSTSPANARITKEQKLLQWRIISHCLKEPLA